MASAINSVPANNASGNASAGAPNPGRSTLRSSNSTKGSDNRRQSGSPVDGGQRYVQLFLLDNILLCISMSSGLGKLPFVLIVPFPCLIGD